MQSAEENHLHHCMIHEIHDFFSLESLEAPTGCWLQESVEPGFSSCIAGIVYGVQYGVYMVSRGGLRMFDDVCVVCHG